MNMDTTTTAARPASTLAGPVFATTTAPATLSPTAKPPAMSQRPNKAELESRLYHAQVRANARRLCQSLSHGPLTGTSATQCTKPTVPFTILVPTPVPAVSPAILTATTLDLLPTPPESRKPSPDRPLLATRRSRVGPVRRDDHAMGLGLSFGFDMFGEDPLLTPDHVFPDDLRRTPGAGRPSVTGGGYFNHLPLDPLDVPSPRSVPIPVPVVGLGITVPAHGCLDRDVLSPAVGLGIVGLDFGRKGNIEEYLPAI